jgi:hypothetical protein
MTFQTGNNGRVGARETNPSAKNNGSCDVTLQVCTQDISRDTDKKPGKSYNSQYSSLKGGQVRRVESISFWE